MTAQQDTCSDEVEIPASGNPSMAAEFEACINSNCSPFAAASSRISVELGQLLPCKAEVGVVGVRKVSHQPL